MIWDFADFCANTSMRACGSESAWRPADSMTCRKPFGEPGSHGRPKGGTRNVFKYLLISIVIVPLLLGVISAIRRDAGPQPSFLKTIWWVYAVVWFGVLYSLRYRWSCCLRREGVGCARR